MAHVPSHHDHVLGEWIGIRAEVDHVVTFNRSCPVNGHELCNMPCADHEVPHEHAQTQEQPIHFHEKPTP
jgi:iron(III) transport system ATP-binding protein